MSDETKREISWLTGGKIWPDTSIAKTVNHQIVRLQYFCDYCLTKTPANLSLISQFKKSLTLWEIDLNDYPGWKKLTKEEKRQGVLWATSQLEQALDKGNNIFAIARVCCNTLNEMHGPITHQELEEALLWIYQIEISIDQENRLRKLTDG